ncbi:MAG: D-glycerate dehydrogenase [Rhodospirillales bacterium]|nr:D-glycerate dehydrogenase [Rhodospirillales bacterium]
MMELFDTQLNLEDAPLSQDQLGAAFATADVVVPTVTDNIDAEIISRAGPKLKLIANFGVGVNHIDIVAANKKGLVITNTPDVLTEDTADLTMALIIMGPRRMSEGERMLRAGGWDGWAPTQHLGHRINGKRLGIIGMGRIGTAVARRALGFGIAIHYHNRMRLSGELEAELEATYWENLDQMIRHMDILSVNCPLTPDTHHLLSEKRLAMLQPHCFVVNAARGGIIDEAALAGALKRGDIGGAALDVFENEPTVHADLMGLENVVLLPHLGSATLEGRIDMGEKVIVNVKTFIDGHKPPDRVLPNLK